MFSKEFDSRYKCIAKWKAHDELVLASAIASFDGKKVYVTGGNDNYVAIWDISNSAKDPKKASKISNGLSPILNATSQNLNIFRGASGFA